MSLHSVVLCCHACNAPCAKRNSMYYTLSFYPRLSGELGDAIDAIRRRHDPTCGFAKPHITVMFPVPDTVGEPHLIGHIQSVLSNRSPFEIRLGGLHKSHDHWLFLTLVEGEEQVKNLYQLLYTGLLAEHRRDDVEFVSHVGLGLFLKEGANYNWDNPQEDEFDKDRYEEALLQARALPLKVRFRVERLQLMRISDEILEWATGKRARIPEDSEIIEVREFSLSG
ncbi:MAG: 2'-5' RNA ligase family protein [Candidatus Eisenbacteria bacterium]